MPEVDSQSKTEKVAAGDGPDPLAGLYHMSNTAGLATQDYVAINPVAIWAAFLGVASVLVVLSNVLLAVPLLGLVCAIFALVQIRSSNGTQTGKGLAIVGLVLTLGFGGVKLGYELLINLRVSADEQQIGQSMHQFGQDVVQGRYDDAYAMFEGDFKEHINRVQFERGFKAFADVPELGRLQSIEWNHQPIAMEERPDTGITDGYAMAYFTYSKSSEPRRVVFGYQKVNGKWVLGSIASIFPSNTKQKKK